MQHNISLIFPLGGLGQFNSFTEMGIETEIICSHAGVL